VLQLVGVATREQSSISDRERLTKLPDQSVLTREIGLGPRNGLATTTFTPNAASNMARSDGSSSMTMIR
jgi:hypothetical protein